MNPVKTRFAPSPTGYLHIGSVRTALFNFLYARSQSGQFLLRIEDTDRERSKPEYENAIYEDLEWLGLKYDGKVTKQSARLEVYRRYADQLVKEGKAIPESMSPPRKWGPSRLDSRLPARQSLAGGRGNDISVAHATSGQALKFIISKKKVVFDDLIHGRVEFDTENFDDLVIIKSDGTPTYNFACVVDDHEQEITHVIRGDDHLSNTPRQWLLYEVLGFKPPKTAHIPLITGSDRSPLSKRLGDVTIRFYREQGYIPAGLLNYFALLGWSPGGNQEFISLSEMARKFSMKAVGKTSATFDEKKLAWINGEHIKSLNKADFLREFGEYVEKYCPLPEGIDIKYAEKVALLFQNRIQTFRQFFEMASFCFNDNISYSEEAASKLSTPRAQELLKKLKDRLNALKNFEDQAVLEKELRSLADSEGVQAADIIHPARAALTGGTVSPGIFELMKTLGKVRVIRRLDGAVSYREEVKG